MRMGHLPAALSVLGMDFSILKLGNEIHICRISGQSDLLLSYGIPDVSLLFYETLYFFQIQFSSA